MPIDIKAPLADRLFALGSTVGPDDPQFKYKSGNTGSYHGNLNMQAPQEDNSDGRWKGIGALAGAALAHYSGAGQPAATNEQGNGYGLGGNLVSGDVGKGDYAGTRGLFSFGDEPQNAGQNGLFDGFTYGSKY